MMGLSRGSIGGGGPGIGMGFVRMFRVVVVGMAMRGQANWD